MLLLHSTCLSASLSVPSHLAKSVFSFIYSAYGDLLSCSALFTRDMAVFEWVFFIIKVLKERIHQYTFIIIKIAR